MKKTRKIMIILMLVLFLSHGPVGGFLAQASVSLFSYIGISIGSIFDKTLRDDMSKINYNIFNSSEEAVVGSQSVSFYKGVAVYRIGNNARSGSFCAILFSTSCDEDDLRHEYGHNVQEIILGPVNFLITIGIPSFWELSERSYYDRPWEITADMFGHVGNRTHTKEDLNRGRGYLAVSAMYGPLGLFYLIGE